MNAPKLKMAHGNWVEGEEYFWGREGELKIFMESLEEGANLLLVAQRRIGKTSLMREAARRLKKRYLCLHVDLQKSNSHEDAIVELSLATRPHASLWRKTGEIFTNILSTVIDRVESLQIDDLSVTLRSGLTGGDWQPKGDRIFAALAASKTPVIVFFDELPILVNRLLKGNDYQITPDGRRQADAFMSWLRKNSIDHKNRVRLVLTGSIGIEPILQQAGLSATLNAFEPFELDPWNPETARGCLMALANEKNIIIEPKALDKVVELIGCCIPHHVQMFFKHIYDSCALQDLRTASEDLVAEVYKRKMLGPRGHADLSHLEERLKMVLGPEVYALALELLTEAAVSNGLTPKAISSLAQQHIFENRRPENVQQEILNVLQHDGYLRLTEGAYTFVSKLQKDWWVARFGTGYIPIEERI